jgi:putative ABC transport system substrate-binding protein
MRRRAFMTGVGGGALITAVSRAAAQRSAKTVRLAIFSPFEPTELMQANSSNRYYRAFFAELRRLGHVEGENLTVERYGREQSAAGSADLAVEVVRSNPDVVYSVGPGTRLLKARTTTIPIVALMGDPIGQGLVQSLARPGGNITGVSIDTGPSVHGKRIELLRELVPSMSKLAYLDLRLSWENYFGAPVRAACEAAGIPLVTELLDLPTSEAAYSEAVAAAVHKGADAVDVADNPDAMTNRALIVNLIGRARLPAMYGIREFVDEGGLIAYAYDLIELNQRAAHDVDAILHGTKPGDIPVFQSTRFELSINLKTAKALGLTVPPLLLARADDVIE